MKKTLIATLVAASALTAVGVASAVDTSGFTGTGHGFYVGGNIGYGYANWKTGAGRTTTTGNYTFSGKDSLAWGLEAGYMFNNNLGVEADYDDFENTKINAGSTQVGSVKNQNYPGLLAVFNLPINTVWSAFAKLGATYLTPKFSMNSNFTPAPNASDKVKIWAPTVALGAGYAFNANLGVNAQVKYIVQQKNVDAGNNGQTTPNYLLATAGVTYKF